MNFNLRKTISTLGSAIAITAVLSNSVYAIEGTCSGADEAEYSGFHLGAIQQELPLVPSPGGRRGMSGGQGEVLNVFYSTENCYIRLHQVKPGN